MVSSFGHAVERHGTNFKQGVTLTAQIGRQIDCIFLYLDAQTAEQHAQQISRKIDRIFLTSSCGRPLSTEIALFLGCRSYCALMLALLKIGSV